METILEPSRTSGNCPFSKAFLSQSPVVSGSHDSDLGMSVGSQVRLCSPPALSPKVLPKLCPFLLVFPRPQVQSIISMGSSVGNGPYKLPRSHYLRSVQTQTSLSSLCQLKFLSVEKSFFKPHSLFT